MATYDSFEEALADVKRRMKKMQENLPLIEKEMFAEYFLKITPNVPIKTGATRAWPRANETSNYADQVAVWATKYVGKIYQKNKTGIPFWDIETADENNEYFIKKFNDKITRFFD